jgi:hypothetical protein
VSAASLLDIGSTTDKKGKKYYEYEFLVRTGEHASGRRPLARPLAQRSGRALHAPARPPAPHLPHRHAPPQPTVMRAAATS